MQILWKSILLLADVSSVLSRKTPIRIMERFAYVQGKEQLPSFCQKRLKRRGSMLRNASRILHTYKC